jgi:ketol-acid reductoisomerase
MRIYREQDANALHLQDRLIGVLGYGNLGRPVALNLRDGGANVIIGNVADAYAEEAQKDRFEVYRISEVVTRANILYMAMPDEVLPNVYLDSIAPYLKKEDLLLFASGYNIAYQMIEPPVFVDVSLIAPRTLASNLRAAHVSGRGYPAYIALHRQSTPHALERTLAVALAMGALKQGALQLTFSQEVALDLFVQQAVLPILHSVFLMASSLLINEGYPEEAVLTELYLSGELGEFLSQASQLGFVHTLEGMSLTAQYGVLSRTERFQEAKLRLQMEGILDSIRDGKFSGEWADEYADGYPRLKRLRDKLKETPVWKLEQAILQLLREE